MKKSAITSHVLDLHLGLPGSGLKLELYAPENSTPLASATTDENGKVSTWSTDFALTKGVWAIKFHTETWFSRQKRQSFFADISIAFKVEPDQAHYHVPLLLNEFGYSTYRGS